MSSTGHVVSSAKAAGEANSVLCKGSYSGVSHQHAHATRSATGVKLSSAMARRSGI